MSEPDKDQAHEIVIVRRRGDGDHDDHHGGVWKVAFADFMTAMMAFFLVLWIVNSTTKQTRSSLARYFNPIRLSDTTPARKGLNDPREVDFDASADGRGNAEAPAAKETSTKSEARNEAASDPDAGRPAVPVKPELAQPAQSDRNARLAPGSYIDPFAARKQSASSPPSGPKLVGKEESAGKSEAEALLARVESKLDDAGRLAMKGGLHVEPTSEGLLISLTDRADMGVFAVGSAEAVEKLNLVLRAVADSLRTTSGSVVVRGHTDARPYRGAGYDNWALSFARAQTGFAGLLRGGLDESRIERVEAHADRRLRNAAAPQAAENRRIEILLRKEGAK